MEGSGRARRVPEGRPLDHPGAEPVDRRLPFDMRPILSRRRELRTAGARAAAAAPCGGGPEVVAPSAVAGSGASAVRGTGAEPLRTGPPLLAGRRQLTVMSELPLLW